MKVPSAILPIPDGTTLGLEAEPARKPLVYKLTAPEAYVKATCTKTLDGNGAPSSTNIVPAALLIARTRSLVVPFWTISHWYALVRVESARDIIVPFALTPSHRIHDSTVKLFVRA